MERETPPPYEMLRRRAAKIICKMNYNSDMAVASLRWSTLQYRREDHVFNRVKNCIAGRFYFSQDHTDVVAPLGKVINN